MKFREILTLSLGPFLLLLILIFLYVQGVFTGLDWQMQDVLMRAGSNIPEDKRIVMVDIDDNSILSKGLWPWPRDLMGDISLQLYENGAQEIIFDIEFIDSGILSVNEEEKDQISDSLKAELLDIQGALKENYISVGEAEQAVDISLNDGLKAIIRNPDEYLGNAIALSSNVWLTLNVGQPAEGNSVAEDAFDYAVDNLALTRVSGSFDQLPQINEMEMRAAIIPIMKHALGAGFTNVDPDKDGVTRRVSLLYRYKDKIFAQLAFRPLLKLWGDPPLQVEPGRIIIKRSLSETQKAPDVAIPVDDKGRMIINWLPGMYDDSFKPHVLTFVLFRQSALENSILEYSKQLGDSGALQLFYKGGDFSHLVSEIRSTRKAALASGEKEQYDQVIAMKKELMAYTADLLQSDFRKQLDDYFSAELARQAGNDTTLIEDTQNSLHQLLDELDARFKDYNEVSAQLQDRLKGAFAIIGNSATSSTDMGVNPFSPVYSNPGVHGNIANTIIQGKFLSEAPQLFSVIAAILSVLALVLLIIFIASTSFSMASGFIVLVISASVLIVLRYTQGFYIGMALPLVSIILSLIYLVIVKFILTDKDKKFIRTAFASYLSPEVIKEIEADPEKLNLGGEKKHMTAMFTDVKGFSTFSEKLDPNDLVKLLNAYLTGMGNIILDKRGTIDKYEGDAIIAFWGAPGEQPDHAKRAVNAAILMKKLENAMNQEFQSSGLAPSPLLTRIGINTGDMTVGNMGTQNRMNYTAMGNAMNLAARLEGVNKQYDTWILTSEYTRAECDDSVTFRSLDRVRVVGINTPVRLFEVVGFSSDISPEQKEGLLLFEEGIRLFEQREWLKADKAFKETMKLIPQDPPSNKFIERSANYFKNPPPENWDGVFTLTSK